MTDKEIELMEVLADAQIKFCALPSIHPADTPDFTFHIHALQNIVLSRDGLRNMRENKSTFDPPIPKREFISIDTSTNVTMFPKMPKRTSIISVLFNINKRK